MITEPWPSEYMFAVVAAIPVVCILSIGILIIFIEASVRFTEHRKKELAATNRIRLITGHNNRIDHLFSIFFERFILFRTSYTGYLNLPNANLRIFATLGTSIVIAVCTLILYFGSSIALPALKMSNTNGASENTPEKHGSIPDDPKSLPLKAALTFMGLWLALFWKEKKDLHSKWEYLADIHNAYLQQPPQSDQNFSAREALRVSLVVDALMMGMWAHRSYYPIFEEVIFEAYCLIKKDNISKEEFMKRISDDHLRFSYKEAEDLIQEYQRLVIVKSKTPNPATNQPTLAKVS